MIELYEESLFVALFKSSYQSKTSTISKATKIYFFIFFFLEPCQKRTMIKEKLTSLFGDMTCQMKFTKRGI